MLLAFRQDASVWETLEKTDLGKLALEVLPTRLEQWSPARLSLLALTTSGEKEQRCAQLEDLCSFPKPPLDSSWNEKVGRSYEECIYGGNTPQTLIQSGLLALALRERYRLNNSWQGLFQGETVSNVGKTSLACLYGMVPHPQELLQALLQPADGHFRPDLVIHVVLSNPLSEEGQRAKLIALGGKLDLKQNLEILRELAVQRPSMVAGMARQLLDLKSHAWLSSFGDRNELVNSEGDLDCQFKSLISSLDLAQVFQLASQPDRSVPILVESLRSIQRLRGHLSAQMAQSVHQSRSSSDDGQQDTANETGLEAWRQAVRLVPDSPVYSSGLVLALMEAGRLDEACSILESQRQSDAQKNGNVQPDHPSLPLASALVALQLGEKEGARQAALQALDLLEKGQELSQSEYVTLARLFLNEDMHQEAARTAQIALKKNPLHCDMLALQAQAQYLLGEPEEALRNAYTALALKQDSSDSLGNTPLESGSHSAEATSETAPEKVNDDIRRLIINSLEAVGAWQTSLDERETLMGALEKPTLEDLHSLMYCAMQAEQPELAVQASKKAFEIDPEDLLTHQRLAEASLMLGDYHVAIQHFKQGTHLAPDKPQLWLGLVKALRLAGEDDKSLTTLRAASQAVPEEAEVHLTLGEVYLEQGELTQALSCLRRAASLASDETNAASERIALRLGQALYQLGHLEEARQVLSKAYRLACGVDDETESSPESQISCPNLELAYAFARTLLGLKELNLAIPMLTEAVRVQPDEPGPSLDLSRALLLVNDQPAGAQRAIPFLQRILGINPDGAEGGYSAALDASPGLRAEARSLLAEAYAAVGDWPQSMEAYRRALDEPLNRDPGKQRRLSLGLGLVALKLEQPEMAVAALEEAAQAEPLDASIQRALSEAYLASGLPRDAYQSARSALDLTPDDLDLLLWFAEQGRRILAQPATVQLPIQEAVIQALRNATQLAPDRPDLLFHLGEVLLEGGDRSNALEVFRKFACADDVDHWLTQSELHQASKTLRELGEAQLAISLLVRVIDRYKEKLQNQGESTISLVDLYEELAYAHQQTGNNEDAQKALDQALSLNAEAIDDQRALRLYLHKGNLLYELRLLDAARDCLETALHLAPSDPTLRYRLAQVSHLLGDLPSALSHAEQAIAALGDLRNSELYQPLHLLAAELAYATLRPQRALAYLQKGLPETNPFYNEFQYTTLRAELALETGNLVLARQEVNVLEKAASNHPRSQGVCSRLSNLQGEREIGERKCRSAVKLINDWRTGSQNGTVKIDQADYIASLLSVSQAAMEFRLWDDALTLLRQLVELAPYEPIAHLKLAQILVLRAEAQCLCQDLEVLEHAPGDVALAEEATLLFESSIKEAERRIQGVDAETTGNIDLRNDESKQTIATWLARGRAVFQPGVDNAQLLEKVIQVTALTPENIAALIMVLRRGEQSNATKTTQSEWRSFLDSEEIGGHPLVLVQLTLSETDFPEAMRTAEEALEVFPTSRSSWPELPMLYFLQARLAYRMASYPHALQTVQKALSIWPQEAHWHALAAQVYQATDPDTGLSDSTKALIHLEQAARMEPGYASYQLELGRAYLETSQFQRSAKALEKASQLEPHHSDVWLLLARAQQANGDLEGAASSLERAIDESTEPTQALLLRGEIALQAENPRGALNRAQTILRSHPEHPQALYLQAQALEALNRPREALAALEKAMQLQENPLPMQLERLRLLKRWRGLDTALTVIQEMVAKDPEQPEMLALLAEWLAEGGKHEAAIQVARQALQEGQSELPNNRSADLHYMIGQYMHQIGQLDQAIHHLSEATDRFPEHLEAYLELGRAYQDRREHKQALKTYQRAINVSGNDYRPYYQAGIVLKDSKDYVAAEAMLRHAAQLAPNEVSVHRLLAAVVALNLVHSHRLATAEQQ